ncbi:family 43 glycosylhydrolase [Hirschia baltica]|uniref:Glycoside hydrolase family 43 n=1 Tax=Hirschia baltica (strain ATCC 49814 / DSM 5838 / IFAM 1418) TaxID=582402 RepID=C6XQH8_HIRBI|nr:family 43 glycosylhydrolase [Hirschia baltica]ACT60477.1 glycoside hydrolase family 43 [Hirschia baltica ATCC 49814]
MKDISRRQGLALLGLGAAAACSKVSENSIESLPHNKESSKAEPRVWGKGYEGQRIADRGDGTFLNPIFAGDHPDPAILKDGDTYYVTFSSFEAYPGLLIYRSYDLVNWEPLKPALSKYIGSVWAPDLIKHGDRFYMYIPARTSDYKSNYVIWADDIEGPWSDPVDLKLHDHIDPGHIVGEDSKRYLFLSNGDMIQLSDDGLSTVGEVKHIYDPWMYPQEWDVECFCPEGPKMLRKGDWFYMLTAVGGTAGPPTSHMVISARSKSVFGPWEHAPNNPQVRTKSRDEQWWSRGHASLVEGPEGKWWLISHGYENGYWTHGRQALLEPVKWRDDDWWESEGGDLSSSFPVPKSDKKVKHGMPFSDDFAGPGLAPQWAFFKPSPDEYDRLSIGSGTLAMKAKGLEPKDSSPLCFKAGDLAYQIDIEVERDPGARGGLLAFYNENIYAGLAFDDEGFIFHRYGMERRRPRDIPKGVEHLFLRMKYDHHILTYYYSFDNESWNKFEVQMEVSGYHHNVGYGFLSLTPGIYAARDGEVRFSNMKYKALNR